MKPAADADPLPSSPRALTWVAAFILRPACDPPPGPEELRLLARSTGALAAAAGPGAAGAAQLPAGVDAADAGLVLCNPEATEAPAAAYIPPGLLSAGTAYIAYAAASLWSRSLQPGEPPWGRSCPALGPLRASRVYVAAAAADGACSQPLVDDPTEPPALSTEGDDAMSRAITLALRLPPLALRRPCGEGESVRGYLLEASVDGGPFTLWPGTFTALSAACAAAALPAAPAPARPPAAAAFAAAAAGEPQAATGRGAVPAAAEGDRLLLREGRGGQAALLPGRRYAFRYAVLTAVSAHPGQDVEDLGQDLGRDVGSDQGSDRAALSLTQAVTAWSPPSNEVTTRSEIQNPLYGARLFPPPLHLSLPLPASVSRRTNRTGRRQGRWPLRCEAPRPRRCSLGTTRAACRRSPSSDRLESRCAQIWTQA